MTKLPSGLLIEIGASQATGGGARTGHSWQTKRDGKLLGSGFAFGDVKEAFEDALDDLRMLGLVTETDQSGTNG